MKVKLKGLNFSNKTLADGSVRTYWYAWKGGPLLRGEPGTPEFMASYYEAMAGKASGKALKKRKTGAEVPYEQTLAYLIEQFQSTNEFLKLAARTRSDYIKQIKLIEQKFGSFPLQPMMFDGTDSGRRRLVRGKFKDWRDKMALKSPRQADYAWTVLARICAIGKDRGLIDINPCERGGRVYTSTRVTKVWTLEMEQAFLTKAPAHLHLPLWLALWTGQRQGDLLRLEWAAYDGEKIQLRPRKTMTQRKPNGKLVVIPVAEHLKTMLDAMPRTNRLVLLNSEKTPWTEDGFRSSWFKAQHAAGINGVTFNDLRGTAVTRLAMAQCEIPEIATITGHSFRTVHGILDEFYLHRDYKLGLSAIRKLELSAAGIETAAQLRAVK